MKKALIAMSGGVDSSIAAYLMKKEGWDCIGCMMHLFSETMDDSAKEGMTVPAEEVSGKACCSLDSAEDARSVCRKLGIPFYVFNFQEDFRTQVIDRFVCAYEQGLTPNPCLDCNRYLKFDRLYERAKVLGCDVIVTGHYARIEEKDGKYVLKKALDPKKDQSYVLYQLSQEQLAHTRFPLGNLTKEETRALAAELRFVNANRPDSQDICFVPNGDYAAVIEKYSKKTAVPGHFVDLNGQVLGEHRGIIHYTVGQRKGLNLPSTEPWFVVKIRPETNEVVLGRAGDVFTERALVKDFHWVAGEVPDGPVHCQARTRYHQPEKNAEARVLPDGRVELRFDEPLRAVTPGQAAVLYDGDTVLGGGIIERETAVSPSTAAE